MKTRFVGVDLAWSDSNPTAVVIGEGEPQVEITQMSEPLLGLGSVLDYLDRHLVGDAVIAVDAPLIIKNQSGQRPCERETSVRFGARHAGAHTSNLNKYPSGAPSLRLAGELEARGYRMDVTPADATRRSGRWFFEVYPHPAHVVLFGLDRIVKYKKGSVTQKREGQRLFARYLSELLPDSEPALKVPPLADASGLRGQALKDNEDKLDALLCCYLAAYYWHWGAERNEMIGDLTDGNIVVPTHSLV